MKMRIILSLLLAFLIASCSQTPTPDPSITPTVDVKATMLATEPTIEVTFDGETCIVEGPKEIPVGTHMFVFHNQSDMDTHMVPMRYYSGNTWEDALTWIEENCGPPGTHCAETAPWMVGIPYEKSVFDDLKTRYKQYDFTVATEYHMWAETSGFLLWPCSPTFVVAE
jgi:hypothetical protein